MGKIFYIMGKSASGKDTIFRELKERRPQLGMVVPYTTRPIRAGEKNGVEYFFTDEAALAKMEAEHKIIEIRSMIRFMASGNILLQRTGRLIWRVLII